MNSSKIVSILFYILMFDFITFVIFYFIILMSHKLFTKAKKDKKHAFIPFYNLYILLEIAKMPVYYYPLYLLPLINIILFEVTCYKLAKVFKLTKKQIIKLLLLPIVYLPILSNSNIEYVQENDEFYIDDILPIIKTQEELNAINKEVEVENKVDSIFKTEQKVREKVPTYKATSKVKIVSVKPVNIKKSLLSDKEDDKIEIVEL